MISRPIENLEGWLDCICHCFCGSQLCHAPAAASLLYLLKVCTLGATAFLAEVKSTAWPRLLLGLRVRSQVKECRPRETRR